MTRRPVDPAEFVELVRGFSTTAFRLEQQPTYAEDMDANYERFVAGGHVDVAQLPGFPEWLDHVRTLTTAGKRMERVRVQTEPLSDYHRYARWVGQWNAEAGEIIHYITRDKAEVTGLLPTAGTDDWWLIDDEQLLVMEFDHDGAMTDRWLLTDEDALDQARTLWKLALAAVRS